MKYIRAADISDLPENQMKAVNLEGKEILLVNLAGSCYAIANKCTHMGGSLVKGTLEGSIVRCPRHGAKFDVKTGESVGEAKIGFIKMKVASEPSYPVKVEGTDILVGMP